MKILYLIMTLAFITNAQSANPVDKPDLPEDGWYWMPSESGTGINLDIQTVDFNETGYSLYGAIYTYDESGNAIWHTFQGDLIPNEDVYAWRKQSGFLAKFESELLVSTDGNCLSCPYKRNSISASSKGLIKITWDTPVTFKVEIDGVKKDYQHFTYHAGLNHNTINFITKDKWQIHALKPYNDWATPHANVPEYQYFKGITGFQELPKSDINKIYFGEGYVPDKNNDWYVSSSTVTGYSSYYEPAFDLTVNSIWPNYILLSYNPDTNFTTAFFAKPVDPENDQDNLYYVPLCNEYGNHFHKGVIRPTTSDNSILYYAKSDSELPYYCEPADNFSPDSFLSLTRMPEVGDIIKDIPFFNGDWVMPED